MRFKTFKPLGLRKKMFVRMFCVILTIKHILNTTDTLEVFLYRSWADKNAAARTAKGRPR